MTLIAKTTLTTPASPSAIFALWADINHWAEFDHGIEWARLEGPFVEGAAYTIRPNGGPSFKATIITITTNKRFIDVSHLYGAKLTFDHSLAQGKGGTVVDVAMSLSGPMAWLWKIILGKNQQADLDQSTQNLVKKAELAT